MPASWRATLYHQSRLEQTIRLLLEHEPRLDDLLLSLGHVGDDY